MKKVLPLLTFVLFWIAFPVASQDVSLVKDVNAVFAYGSSPFRGITMNGVHYFTAFQLTTGTELWRTDGTDQGTWLVKDIFPGIESSSITNYRVVGNTIYFTATSANAGTELWKSDGTTAGTVLVKDIYPGGWNASPSPLSAIGNTLYFFASDGIHGFELWKTDGTEGGTVMVKDIVAGPLGSVLNTTTSATLGDVLFFGILHPDTGVDLWKTDGTAAGTTIVKDITPPTNSNGEAMEITAVNGEIFFRATSIEAGSELWKSDGTEAGTLRVKDINVGTGNAGPAQLRAYHDKLIFSATGPTGSDVYISDGTEAGTTVLKNFTPSFPNIQMTGLANDLLFFVANDGTNGAELWRTDGTPAGTFMTKDVNPGANSINASLQTASDNRLYFVASDGVNGNELWKSDGTNEGTTIVSDLSPGGSSSILFMGAIGEMQFFRFNDPDLGEELYKSSGTPETTGLVKDINNEGYTLTGITTNMLPVGNKLYFFGNDNSSGYELWTSDGSEAGTNLVEEYGAGFLSIYISTGNPSLAALNDKLVFIGLHNNQVRMLQSNGTAEGTDLLPALNETPTPAGNVLRVGDKVYFRGSTPTTGHELWVTDGTDQQLVKDIYIGSSNSLATGFELIGVGETLFFTAYDGTNISLYKTNGSEASTFLIKNLQGPGTNGFPNQLKAGNTLLYFVATDGVNGYELWKSDGSAAGTTMVKDIAAGAGSSNISNLFFANNILFFSADNGTGVELWRSDGTEAGTYRVKDINAGAGSSFPNTFSTGPGGLVYFQANDGTNGNELWKTDGTEGGTAMVVNLTPGSAHSNIQYTTSAVGYLFFQEAATGIYRSDGTAAGTELITSEVSVRSKFHEANGYLFFNGYHPFTLNELWKINLSFPALQVVYNDAARKDDEILEFGNVNMLSTGYKDIVLKNIGNEDLIVYEYEFDDDDSGIDDYKMSNPPTFPITIAPGQSTTLTLSFTPEIAESRLAYITIETNDISHFNIPITGTGVKNAQEITFTVGDKVIGDAPFALSANTTSALPVVFSTDSDNITLSENMVTIVSPGRASITATQAGNENYNVAEKEQSFCINPAKPSISQGEQHVEAITLTSTSTTGNKWYLNGNLIAGQTGQTLAASEQGSYTVQVTVNECTSAMSDAAVVVITSIDAEEHEWRVYPNPVEDVLRIEGPQSSGATTLSIFNIQGKKILDTTINGSVHSINVSDYTKGFYYLKMSSRGKIENVKFIKK